MLGWAANADTRDAEKVSPAANLGALYIMTGTGDSSAILV